MPSRQQLRQWLTENMQSETERLGLDADARLRWLVDHLEEYVGRWLGFCALPAVPEKGPLTDVPGFDMVFVGVDAVGDAFREGPVSPQVEAVWQSVTSSLALVSAGGGKRRAQELHDRVIALCAALSPPRSAASPD